MACGPYSSPTFDRNASIDLAEQVGSASISPSARDIALVSAAGLRILDLDHPEKDARLIRCNVRSGVADVQWSPHAFRDSWICSTTGPVALLWDVSQAKDSSPLLEQFRGHSRSITDINFSAHHPEIIATCSIDTFIHLWDVRAPAQPVIKFADWNESVSQVKFNRQDEHVLASSQGGRLDIWDDRNGAVPIRSIKAHATKIYGIDWHREYRESILTCSLDKSIKLWNWTRADDAFAEDIAGKAVDRVIRTGFPVWRARYTPFGHGILAMPQRSDTRLHLYDSRTYRLADRDAPVDSVHLFRGHLTPVKEFLWRHRGGVDNNRDMRDFQLVSVSADQSVRLHHMMPSILAKIGYHKGAIFDSPLRFTRKDAEYRSFVHDGIDSAVESRSSAQRSYISLPVASEAAPRPGLHKVPIAASERPGGAAFANSRTRASTEDDFVPSPFPNASLESRGTASSAFPTVSSDEALSIADGHYERRPSMSQLSSRHAAPASFTSKFGTVPEGFDTSSYIAAEQSGTPATPSAITTNEFEDDFDDLDLFDEDDDDEDDAFLGAFIRTTRPSRLADADSLRPAAEVPPPRTCSARWSANGELVCLLPRKQTMNDDADSAKIPDFRGVASLLTTAHQYDPSNDGSSDHSLSSLGGLSDARSGSMFQASGLDFGKSRSAWLPDATLPGSSERDRQGLHGDFKGPNENPDAVTFSQGATRDEQLSQLRESFDTGGSGKSSSLGRYGAAVPSHRNVFQRARQKRPEKMPLAVSIRSLSHLLPAKRLLAIEYLLIGDAVTICTHNANVSSRHGFKEHSRAWEEAALLLRLRSGTAPQGQRDEQSQQPRIRSPTSGWRPGHPLGLHRMQKILHSFEEQADEQMLAMLAFVLDLRPESAPSNQPRSEELSSEADTETGEEDDEATPMVQSKRARMSARVESGVILVRWKNDARFKARGRAKYTNREIDAALFDRCRRWRVRYADLLYSWGLYEARAQMLKSIGTKTSAIQDDLYITLDPLNGVGSLSECSICNTKIHGEAKLCSAGMHCLHESCYQLFESLEPTLPRNACPMGCHGPRMAESRETD